MKEHRVSDLISKSSNCELSALLLVSIGFLIGGICGCFFAGSVSGSGTEVLSGYIQDFLTATKGGTLEHPHLFATLWSVFRWPLIALVLGCSIFGVIGIPILFAVRGFLFSFCVASFVRVLGSSGVLFAFLLLGMESLLTIPVLFLLGTHSVVSAAAQTTRHAQKGKKSTTTKQPYLRYVACAAVLLMSVFWESTIVPRILNGAVKLFSV